ncbi:response regulator [Stakelama tenebrarum]|uniref:Response regulator n=1 Tax=Stakelama tenebrarum TaxID=2711215 RepID=A0A6G6Y5V5_9SPHN|nr:response regulator [Sphingosinithalassobacter tenebrarum]QIG80334.1 response regulator [Sphingosinithalassobacter tenebrarum]
MLFGKKKRHLARLLVVEDEPLVAFENEHFLSDEGYEVMATVDSVAHAVRVIASRTPLDLVLADIHLADGSGIDVARAAADRGIPVLFVTGQSPGEAAAFAAGCLSKPYHQRDLLLAIEAIEAVVRGETPRRLPPQFRLFDKAA